LRASLRTNPPAHHPHRLAADRADGSGCKSAAGSGASRRRDRTSRAMPVEVFPMRMYVIVIRNPQKDRVQKIAVILRKAPPKTVFTLQGLCADRRIFIGTGRGPSHRGRRSRQDRAPIVEILRSAHRQGCDWEGRSARLSQNDTVRFIDALFRISYKNQPDRIDFLKEASLPTRCCASS
jgi:hypothetical protein